MIVTKYNPKTGRCALHRLPDGAILETDDMDKVVPCADCGRDIKFGESHTSRTILTQKGLGFPICESCYKNEWEKTR